MEAYFLSHEGEIYTGCYFFAIALVAGWEALAPRKALRQPMGMRWFSNIAVTVIDILLVRALFPLLGIALALEVTNKGWGLMPWLNTPPLFAFLMGLLILDFNNYLQHYLLHKFPILWRLHRMHHSDTDYDFSTSLRFHPLEAIFSVALELLVIAAFGIPAFAYLIYKIIRVLMAAFVHGNLLIPTQIDRALRIVLVTPDLHRIHHSLSKLESNSNFAGVTPLWDRIFGTYLDQPSQGHEALEIGLKEFREDKYRQLHWMLLQPFLKASRLSGADQPTMENGLRPETANKEL